MVELYLMDGKCLPIYLSQLPGKHPQLTTFKSHFIDNQVGKLARAVGIPTEVLDDNCPVSQRIAVLREMIRIKISD